MHPSSKKAQLTLTRLVFSLEKSHDANDQHHDAEYNTSDDLRAHSRLNCCTIVVSLMKSTMGSLILELGTKKRKKNMGFEIEFEKSEDKNITIEIQEYNYTENRRLLQWRF